MANPRIPRRQFTLKLALGTWSGQSFFKPVGWEKHGAPVSWSDLQGGKTGAQKWRSAVADPRIDSCPQAAFLTFGCVAFAAGFGASLAFSFAANSCLTLRLMASTSTL